MQKTNISSKNYNNNSLLIKPISSDDFRRQLPKYVSSNTVAELLEKIIRTDINRELFNDNSYKGITDEHMLQISSWAASKKASTNKALVIKLIKIFCIVKSIDKRIDFKVRLLNDDFEIWAILPQKNKELFKKVSNAICDYEIDNKDYVSTVIIAKQEISNLEGMDFFIEL